MLRHFNLVSVCDFDDASLTRVYGQIADWWCRRRVPSDVASKTPNLVKATLEIYNTIKLQLLPTPSKSHYTYNMRDLSKVWQGVSMGNVKKDLGAVVRLWRTSRCACSTTGWWTTPTAVVLRLREEDGE